MTAGITSYGYPGTVLPGAALNIWNYGLNSRYGVYYWNNLTPTMVSGGTRQVSIGTGRCWAAGIADYFTTAQVVSLPAPSANSEYWLIVVRRTWQTANKTTVEYIPAGTSKPAALADIAGRSDAAGTVDDQPVCLVRVDKNDALPKLIYDLRMVGSGVVFYMAEGINPAQWVPEGMGNAKVRCGSKTYVHRPTADGLLWEPDPYIITSGPSKGNALGLQATSGWVSVSQLDSTGARSPSTGVHHLRLQVCRSGKSLEFSPNLGGANDSEFSVATISNPDFIPPYGLTATGVYRTETGSSYNCGVYFDSSSIRVTSGTQSTSIGKRTDGGWSLRVNFDWIA